MERHADPSTHLFHIGNQLIRHRTLEGEEKRHNFRVKPNFPSWRRGRFDLGPKLNLANPCTQSFFMIK